MEAYTSTGTTLRDYLRVVFRHKTIFIITLITVMVTVFVKLELKTPVYVAQVKMLVSAFYETESEYYKGIGARWLTTTQIEIVKSRPVIERVVKALKLYERPPDYEKKFASRLKAFLIDRRIKKHKQNLEEMTPEEMTPEENQAFLFNMAMGSLSGSISAAEIEETNMFIISVRDFSPVQAAIIANSVSRSYVIFDLEQQIAELQLNYGKKHSLVIQLKNHVKNLQNTLDGRLLPDIEAIGPASVKIIGQAQSGARLKEGISKQLTLNMAFFMSLFLSVLLAFVFDYLDQTFKLPWEVEGFLNIPVLCSIPKRKSKDKLLISADNPKTTNYTQSFQALSNQISLLMKDKNLKSLLITDVEGSEGATILIANLGIFLAHKAGHRVLIIDANLRSPLISKIFNISNSKCLINVLEEKIQFEDAIQDLGSHLHVLPADVAVSNPVIILGSSMMSDVIKKAKEQYEIVLINCLDLNNFTDAVILSSFTDGTALIVN